MDVSSRKCVAGAAVLLATLTLFAERQPYERYQSIVDRQMFGAPPPGFDPTKPPSEVSKADAREAEAQLTKEQEQIRSAIHFSVINVTPSGETAVGFTDNGDSKNPVHYYLKVGEQRNGWLVKEADPVKATMTIAKGEVEVSLSIGGNSARGGAVTKSSAAGSATASILPAPANDAAKPGILVNKLQPGNGSQLNSLRSRRLLREQQRQQEAAAREAEQAAAEERRREDEARREEERLQREAEREEQRAQLQQIKEELRKAREEREASSQQDQLPPPPDMEDGPPPPVFE